jgi:hypothetical protein
VIKLFLCLTFYSDSSDGGANVAAASGIWCALICTRQASPGDASDRKSRLTIRSLRANAGDPMQNILRNVATPVLAACAAIALVTLFAIVDVAGFAIERVGKLRKV